MKSSDSTCTGSGRLERKTVEKNRRMHMKNLCMKLASLIPKDQGLNCSKDASTQVDHLGQSASYIVKLKDRIEMLKQQKEMMMMSIHGRRKEYTPTVVGRRDGRVGRIDIGGGFLIQLPVVEVRQQDLNLEVVLISELHNSFKLHQVIGIIEEEGAEVVNASFSVVDDKIFHTIHSKVLNSRIGLDIGKVSERLEELIR